MEARRVAGDARHQKDVLDLLNARERDGHPQGFHWAVGQRDDDRQDAAQPRTEIGDDLQDARQRAQEERPANVKDDQRNGRHRADRDAEQELTTKIGAREAINDPEDAVHVLTHRLRDQPVERPDDLRLVVQHVERPEGHDNHAKHETQRLEQRSQGGPESPLDCVQHRSAGLLKVGVHPVRDLRGHPVKQVHEIVAQQALQTSQEIRQRIRQVARLFADGRDEHGDHSGDQSANDRIHHQNGDWARPTPAFEQRRCMHIQVVDQRQQQVGQEQPEHEGDQGAPRRDNEPQDGDGQGSGQQDAEPRFGVGPP